MCTGGLDQHGHPLFKRLKAPVKAELEYLVHTLSTRMGRYPERQGLLMRDIDNSFLTLEPGG